MRYHDMVVRSFFLPAIAAWVFVRGADCWLVEVARWDGFGE